MREDITIHFDKINGTWLWTLEKGDYKIRGTQDTLEKAEQYAYEVAGNLPDVGTIHTLYNPSKPVMVEKGNIKDAFADDYIVETFDKQED